MHTPGPWFTDALECVFTEREGGGLLICNARNSAVPESDRPTRQQAEANARLIAAAPDLLEALEDAIAQVEATVPLDWKDMGLQYPNVKAWRAATARSKP